MTNVAKHTPGPWELPTGFERVVGDEDCPMTPIFTNGDPFSVHAMVLNGKNGEANAHLIVAAPELLEALEGVLRVADRKTDEFDKARAAIAKAKGESSSESAAT